MSAAYHRFCGAKKMREDLASFLPHLVGNFNFDSSLEFRFAISVVFIYPKNLFLSLFYLTNLENLFPIFFDAKTFFSSLRMLVEKPPITGKEITSLSSSAMAGFRLTPGAVPEPYRSPSTFTFLV